MEQYYYRQANGVMIFVDLNEIFNQENMWSINQATNYVDVMTTAIEKPPCLLVGTKVCTYDAR